MPTKAELEAKNKELQARNEHLVEVNETLQRNLESSQEHYQHLLESNEYFAQRLKDAATPEDMHPGLPHCEGCEKGLHDPPPDQCCHVGWMTP